ncbi:putative oxidoreductase C26F1.07 [Pseudocercospora fuligena]|uniref:Putative oxidoreductase C26F1.07 n=1 Tax=Pseudocercospora fuligena TaxID=685502 RepID=A0A8H6RCJ5_9PEZI|nr:putative oxidoreductase C26F1.07 [Pseudocercospora fuligena]
MCPPHRSLKTFTLNTGAKIPAIGLGTFQDPDEQEDAVATALKLGYRHIDTARVYDTEKQVGRGMRKSGVPREDIFLTTKLWSNSHHPDDVEPAINDSLADMQTDYLDLLLMHYPCSFKRGPNRFPREDASGEILLAERHDYVDCWKAMEGLLKTGKVKAIGMSNFSKGEMETILERGNVHSFTAWHREHGIQLIQFSPFANQNTFYKHGQSMPKLLEEPVLHEIGHKYSKSAAQVALAWGISKGRCVIPKSTIPWQLEQNLDSEFDLAAEDMARIDAMDKKLRFNLKGLNYGWKLYSDLEGIGRAPSVELSPF